MREGMTANIEPATVTDVPATSKKRSVFRYLLLPGIVPQAKELSRGGFGFLAYLIAYVYQGVRILPKNHPYTNISNLGTFGLRQVIAEAANNVRFSRSNIDQIVVFFAVMAGIVIMALQFISFIILIISGEAFAGPPTPSAGIFTTEFPDTDIAFSMLREVFGIPDLFGTLPNGVSAFHTALHGLFNFYNLAILIVAVIVFIYYVIVVVAETAQTGTPFGQRFSHIYAPFRLVIAIGLLVPLNYGFNAAQYITLYAAKMGSGFASTGWIAFNDSLTDNPLGVDNRTLISPVRSPSIDGLVEFMGVVHACRAAYETFDSTKTIEARIKVVAPSGNFIYLALGNAAYGALAGYNNADDIKIEFGHMAPGANWTPYCGEVTTPINVPLEAGQVIQLSLSASAIDVDSGTLGYMQFAYFNLVNGIWQDARLREITDNVAAAYHTRTTANTFAQGYLEDSSAQTARISFHRAAISSQITQHYQDAAAQSDFSFSNETRIRGWGGAGIWYNRLAEINGGYTVATLDLPSPSKVPLVMKKVLDEKKAADNVIDTCTAYEPNLANNQPVTLTGNDLKYAQILNVTYKYFVCDNEQQTKNVLIDTASAIFGLEGLIAIRDTYEVAAPTPSNPSATQTFQIHPLAKLSALGKGLIESSISNIGYSFAFAIGGGAFNILSPQLGKALTAASQMFVSIGVIGLSIGFITFYILPFLPFIYFFFAVGGWVKGIFEAMVGAPLWALAHLRIDGDGIPGKMAMNGYFLIFEIFIRPILTVFGLIGGMAIFSAMAAILNEVFDLVVLNTGGVELDNGDGAFSRNTIDTFFFTIVYAIILYMMALASFKMITLVPNSIIRWMGQSISSFNDNAGDPAGSLTSYAAIGGNQLGSKLAGGLAQGGQAIGAAGGGTISAITGIGRGG